MSFIEKEKLIEYIQSTESAVAKAAPYDQEWFTRLADRQFEIINQIEAFPEADVLPIPPAGIGDLSDGYHTFNGLYYQRMILFAALVKTYREKAWKSYRHEDGELCFGGGWFIVGIDTPEGSYTYHYEAKDWDLFDCTELGTGKHWDGHTEDDVTRLLSLQADESVGIREAENPIPLTREKLRSMSPAEITKEWGEIAKELKRQEEKNDG